MDLECAMIALKRYAGQHIAASTAEAPAWNMERIRAGDKNSWNYIDGCMISAILSLYEITGDEKYLAFADDFLNWFILPDGSIKTFDMKTYNLDNVNPAKNLLKLYSLTRKEKYLLGAKLIRRQLSNMPRTKAGSFWHKAIYPWQVWLDGLYMAQPFYMQYELTYNAGRGCADSIAQFQNVYRLMRRPDGLYCHGYDESRSMYWADPHTGQSANCWLRALGWFVAALVDTLEIMGPALQSQYPILRQMLSQIVDAFLPWQHESGLFYQVIDLPNENGNYLETSGTALLAYGIFKGVRLGYLPKAVYAQGEKAFFGIIEKYLQEDPKGDQPQLTLGGICLVAGLGGASHRDGSAAYYFQEPIVENEAKGVAPLLMAYAELLWQSERPQ